MTGMTLTIFIYVDKMPHLDYCNPMGMGGWQETEE
jgi:hypothetical protein